MIQMSNLELLQALPALQELADTPLPAVASVRIVRIARAVDAAARDVQAVQRQTVDRYTRRDASGAPASVLDENGDVLPDQVGLTDPEAFQREMSALLEAPTRLEVDPLRVGELGLEARIAPRTLLQLGPLLEMDGEG
jgi:hypothetical protein